MKVPVEPGIYPGTPYEVYDSWNARRVSELKWASFSAKHLKWALDGRLERKETDALTLGTAIHMRLLEQDRYEIFMQIAQTCSCTYKGGAKKGQPCTANGKYELNGKWFCSDHNPPESAIPDLYVTADEAAMIEELNHEIRLHPVVKILRSSGGCELSAAAELEGVPMKCRIDKLIEPTDLRPYATVVDIKTKQPGTVDLEKCRKQSHELAYHVQGAVYRRMLRKLKGWDDVHVIFLFVEKGPPHDCLAIMLSEWDLAAGDNAFLDWIKTYKEGVETDKWPGASETIETGLLPDWAYKYYGVNKV